jgi:hypothetical protein
MRPSSPLLFLPLAFVLLGCPVGHQSPPARAQEAATELNTNTRFGRLELATERVAPKSKEAFLVRRKAWGAAVRVADYELAGFEMRGKEDAEMIVKVAWYRITEGDLRVTLIRQSWHDYKGEWKLVDESRADGDVGLLGEPSPAPTAHAVKNAHFPTIRLGEAATSAHPAHEAPAADGEPPEQDAASR